MSVESIHLPTRPLLDRVVIENLFGTFNYRIERPAVGSGEDDPLRRLILLYGDNGSGKTTLLQLIWHILSPAKGRSHRTFVASTPFSRFQIDFDGIHSIEVTKREGLIGDFDLQLHTAGVLVLHVPYRVNEHGVIPPASWPTTKSARRLREERRRPETLQLDLPDFQGAINEDDGYLKFLSDREVSPFFLADDRNIYSDEIDRFDDRIETVLRDRERRWRAPEDARRAVSEELVSCLDRVNEEFWRITLGAQSAGSVGADTVYTELLERLFAGANAPDKEDGGSIQSFLRRAKDLERRSHNFSDFGLAPPFRSEQFTSLLPRLDGERRKIAEDVLRPYFDSVETRLDALAEAESIVRTFRDQANHFLKHKRLDYDIRTGVSMSTLDGVPLEPSMLSSGERQLVLLLCNTVLARFRSRLFIIDEPELSLNVKWQRRILRALLACTEGSQVQFLIATHSIEMITGHRASLVRLDDE